MRNKHYFVLSVEGEQLEEDMRGTVESFGIVHESFLDFCQRLKGGSGKLTALPGKISLTQDPCCITYDDNPSTARARMPCGCPVSAYITHGTNLLTFYDLGLYLYILHRHNMSLSL